MSDSRTSRKQVVFIHYTLPPVIGGVEFVIEAMAEVLARNGYVVSFLAGRGSLQRQNIKTSIIPEIDSDNPHIREYQQVMKLGVLPENYDLNLDQLCKKFETEIGDIQNIVIHNVMTMSDNLLLTHALWNYINKFNNKRYFIYTHDLSWLMDEGRAYQYDKIPWNLVRTAIPFAHYITISEHRRRQIAEVLNLPLEKITVVPNGIRCDEFLKFDPCTSEIISRLQLVDKFPLILLPVRFIPRKNIIRSLEIISHLKAFYPNLQAIVTAPFYTEKSDYFAYQKIVVDYITNHNLEKEVVFLSNLLSELGISQEKNHTIVWDLFFFSHLVLYLSSDEGFGLPILEAGLAKAPLVVSNIPVFREIVSDQCLILDEEEKVETSARKIVSYLEHLAKTPLSLYRKVVSNYNWNYIWEKYLKPILEG